MNTDFLALLRQHPRELAAAVGKERAYLLLKERGTDWLSLRNAMAKYRIGLGDIFPKYTSLVGDLPAWLTFTRSTEGTYRDADTLIKVAAIYAPRFDYDRQGRPLGLMVEPQRTNFCQYSTDPQTAWDNSQAITLNATITSNGIPDPMGGTDAIRLRVDVDDDAAAIIAISSAPAGDVVASSYVFDTTLGTILAAALLPPYISVQEYACGCRIQVFCESAPENVLGGAGYMPGLLDPVLNSEFSFWGAQVEAIPSGQPRYASSLIVTQGATATRQADAIVSADDVEYVYRAAGTGIVSRIVVDAGDPLPVLLGHFIAARRV